MAHNSFFRNSNQAQNPQTPQNNYTTHEEADGTAESEPRYMGFRVKPDLETHIGHMAPYDRLKNMPDNWPGLPQNKFAEDMRMNFDHRYDDITEAQASDPEFLLRAYQHFKEWFHKAKAEALRKAWKNLQSDERIRLYEERDRKRDANEKRLVQHNIQYKTENARMTALLEEEHRLSELSRPIYKVLNLLHQRENVNRELEELSNRLENAFNANDPNRDIRVGVEKMMESQILKEAREIRSEYEHGLQCLINVIDSIAAGGFKEYLKKLSKKDEKVTRKLMDVELLGFVDSRALLASYCDGFYDRAATGRNRNVRQTIEQEHYDGWNSCDLLWKQKYAENLGELKLDSLVDQHRAVNIGVRLALGMTILKEDEEFAAETARKVGIVTRVHYNNGTPIPGTTNKATAMHLGHPAYQGEPYPENVANSYHGLLKKAYQDTGSERDCSELLVPLPDIRPVGTRSAEIIERGRKGELAQSLH
ncbi:hypothetical protein DM02DRAFT_690282 [Periconia macrospinosa]|uniref:Uncharacterized protein n=1 Tax=Periconia macrospinosa TaxID=97972 RepID=A0A2V1DBH4_9PLEO|nr:hypothetical protein DM02DRAFT_690282 [Periconia macrospinosa]